MVKRTAESSSFPYIKPSFDPRAARKAADEDFKKYGPPRCGWPAVIFTPRITAAMVKTLIIDSNCEKVSEGCVHTIKVTLNGAEENSRQSKVSSSMINILLHVFPSTCVFNPMEPHHFSSASSNLPPSSYIKSIPSSSDTMELEAQGILSQMFEEIEYPE